MNPSRRTPSAAPCFTTSAPYAAIVAAMGAIVIGALLCASGAAGADATAAPESTDGAVHTRSVRTDFDTVRFDIESAIENRGYVIDYHARVGEMLERTAADVGAEETVYRAAETWQFCSAILSRHMVEADPSNIAYCPFVVFAYETRAAPGTVVVGFRASAGAGDGEGTGGTLAAIDRELAAIVAEAAE